MRFLTRFLGPIFISLACLLSLSACQQTEFSRQKTTEHTVLEGSVATVNHLATLAAERVFAKGGNAVDAAVAAALTLGVVDGHNSGIGGGCFILLRRADGTIEAIDGREMAPAAADKDMYLRNGQFDPQLSKTGALAVGIPGSVAAYEYLVNKAGQLAFADLLLSAADLAEQGFAIDRSYAERIARKADQLSEYPETARLLLDQGRPLAAGHRLVQADLANTYRKIAEQGSDYFYRGEFAKRVAQWMQANDGIVTAEDFAQYQLKFRAPLMTQYRGYTIVGFPPPSSGGVHVAQILNMLEGFDVASLSAVDRYHLLAETMKLAFADRAYWLGDPDFVDVPRGLIAPSYAHQLAAHINFKRASHIPSPGMPAASDSDLFGKHTTHIATADAQGNWVAITATVNTSFGSKVIIPGTGVIMNNQMDDFSAQPGTRNAFGLVGGQANSIAPGKRPLSSMSPTIVLNHGQPVLTLGAAGGPTIITQVVQALVNVIDLNMPLDKALGAPRIHHQWKPDRLYVESVVEQAHRRELERRGHLLIEQQHHGATQAIGVDSGQRFISVVEPRLAD